jgi:cellulase/cellobiase CelA1
MELAPEVEKQIASSDTAVRVQREKQLREMPDAAAHIANSALDSLSVGPLYDAPDRFRMAAALRADLPKLLPGLPPYTRNDLIRRVHEMARSEGSVAVKAELDRLDEAIGGATLMR